MFFKNMEDSRIESIITLIYVIAFPLSIYTLGIGSVKLSEWLFLIIIAYSFARNKLKLKVDEKYKKLLVFSLISFPMSLIANAFDGEIYTIAYIRYFRYLIAMLAILISNELIVREKFIKYYKIACILISTYIILQALSYSFVGIIIPNKILPFPLAREFDATEVLSISQRYYYRGYGIFNEPSDAAKYLLPGFAFSLYGWGEKNIDLKSSMLILVSILITTSLQGIVGVVFLLGFWVFQNIHKKNKFESKSLVSITLFIFLLIGSFLAFSKQESFSFVSQRIGTISGNGNMTGSAKLRLLRGYAVFAQIPDFLKIIGVGFGNLDNYIIKNGIQTSYDIIGANSLSAIGYVNGVSCVLLYTGLIGGVFLFSIFADFWKHENKEYRLIIILYVLLLLSGGGIFDMYMVFLFTIFGIGYTKNTNA